MRWSRRAPPADRRPLIRGRTRRGADSPLGGLLALTLVSVGFGALSPALAEIQDAFGGGAGLGALLVSGFGAGRLLAGFPAGVLVDRVGADRVVLGGALLFLVGSLVGWAAPHFPILAIGRFIQGAGCAVVPAGVLARMMAGAAAERAGGPMAVYQAAITIGVALGPAVGGPLAAVAGWRSALLFCAAAGLAACALVLPASGTGALRGVPARRAADDARPRGPGWRAGLAVTLVMLPNAVVSFDRFGVGLLALPLYAAGPAGFDATATGLLLGTQTAVTLAVLGPAGWASNRWGVRRVVVGAVLLVAVGIALMPLLPGAVGLWTATLVYAVGMSALGVSGALYVFSLPGHSTGTLVAIYRLSTDAVQVVGPLAVGWALDSLGFRPVFFGMAACGILALVGLLARTADRR